MSVKFSAILAFLCLSIPILAQVSLTSSNIPILLIDTDSQFIVDEPKIKATLKIIDNGLGTTNFITDTPTDYDGFIGIEIRGQSSRNFPKKPYGFETRTADGANNNVSLLGMPKENDWVLHNPFSDKSLIRNALTYILAGRIMDYAPRVRLVEVVLNEVYQGVYLLTEKIKRDKNRVPINKISTEDITGGYILKFDKGFELIYTSSVRPIIGRPQVTNFLIHEPKINEITSEQTDYIQNYLQTFEETLSASNFTDSISGYRPLVDIETFIDFLFINELTKNVDGYRISSFMYKDSDAVDARLKMGPVWDFNLGLGNADYCQGGNYEGWAYNFNDHCPNDNWVVNFWWKRFLEDPYFRKMAKEKWLAYREKELSDEVIFGTIDSLSNLLNAPAGRNFQQWPILNTYIWPNNFVGGNYRAEIDYLKDWTQDRLAWMDQQFLTFDAPTPDGTIFLNSISVYPNPSNQLVKFEFSLSSDRKTAIRIYNALGQVVKRLPITALGQNKFETTWSDLPAAGIYHYQIFSFEKVEFEGAIVVKD